MNITLYVSAKAGQQIYGDATALVQRHQSSLSALVEGLLDYATTKGHPVAAIARDILTSNPRNTARGAGVSKRPAKKVARR